MDKAISASGLKKIKTCPKQYQFRYLTDIEGTKLSEGYLELGNAVHESIEEVLRQREALDLSDRETVTERLQECYGGNNDDVPDGMIGDGEDCLDVAGKFISKNSDVTLQEIEEWHYFDLDENDESVAVMDVCTENEIWDWKTGKVRAHDEKIQAGIYAMAYEDKFGHPPDEVKFVYLKKEKIRGIDPDEQDWSEVWDYVGQLRRSHAMDEWPANPGDACHFCQWEGACSASPVGAGDIKWEQY